MFNRRSHNRSPQEHAQKQLRDLGAAVLNTVKELDKSYPNQGVSARILQQYEQKIASTTRRTARSPQEIQQLLDRSNAHIQKLMDIPESRRPSWAFDQISQLTYNNKLIEEKYAKQLQSLTPKVKPKRYWRERT